MTTLPDGIAELRPPGSLHTSTRRYRARESKERAISATESQATTQVGCVIVSYESHAVVPALLASLAAHEPDVPVVVVDNASPSGPPDIGAYRAQGRPDRVELLRMDRNCGYAAACNAGVERLRRHRPRYLAFLNPDVRLTGPSLSELRRTLADRPNVGIASGPVVGSDGRRIQSAHGPSSQLFPLWLGSGWRARRIRVLIGRLLRRGVSSLGAPDEELRIEGHVLAGVMMVSTGCFDEVDGFDEDYFLYWSDADLCERVRATGVEVRILECTPFVHAPTSGTPGIPDEQRWEWYASGAGTFARKHLPPGQAEQLTAALKLGRRLRELRAQRPAR